MSAPSSNLSDTVTDNQRRPGAKSENLDNISENQSKSPDTDSADEMSGIPFTINGAPSGTQNNAAVVALSKRTREVQALDGISVQNPYRPPALRENENMNTASPTAQFEQRRARAGTMPSLPRYEYSQMDENLPPQMHNQNSGGPLRHSHSSNLSSAQAQIMHQEALMQTTAQLQQLQAQANRMRAGSLTLPANGLKDPFGKSLFYTMQKPLPTLSDELRSFHSNGEIPPINDDSYIKTLDYLGLADSSPSVQMEDLKSAQRNRAYTVSTSQSHRMGSKTQFGANLDYEEMARVDGQHTYSPYPIAGSTPLRTFKTQPHLASNRARATTVGVADQSKSISSAHARSGVQFPEGNVSVSDLPMSAFDSPQQNSLLRSSLQHNLSTTMLATPQTPEPQQGGLQASTRSLWIGNLDVGTSAQELMHVFAPYGAIESLRLLPEKECGFVNFVEKSDAARAKDDVLNRLGGRIINSQGGTSIVRIGFGRIDSSPVTPAAAHTHTFGEALQNGSANASMIDPSMQAQGTTRALWVGSIPPTTTTAALLSIFTPFGPVESARVLTHKNCGFINFERLEDAIRAHKSLNGREILGSDLGAIKVGFAKAPTRSGTGSPFEEGMAESTGSLAKMTLDQGVMAVQGLYASGVPTESHQLSSSNNSAVPKSRSAANESDPTLMPLEEQGLNKAEVLDNQQMVMKLLCEGSANLTANLALLEKSRPPVMYYSSVPPVPEKNGRKFELSRLREVRKTLDSGLSGSAVEKIAEEWLEDCAELASDYVGNTIVQKFFEVCGASLREKMIKKVAPHLAMISTHKNGTWAAQKIIDCAKTKEERQLIVDNLKPYTPALMNDSFSNYAIQGCLKFGSPMNDFIFDAIIDRTWEVAQGRFGARSMRSCLESNITTDAQRKTASVAIVLNSIPLSTNSNGALLLTWFLEASNMPNRYTILANRFAPHIAHLMTHKIASVTVMRLLNQSEDTAAFNTVLSAIFDNPENSAKSTLREILHDQNTGASSIQKVLALPQLDADDQTKFSTECRSVLASMSLTGGPVYRRLMEDLGMPVTGFVSSPPMMSHRSPPVSSYGSPLSNNGSENYGSMLSGMNYGMHVGSPHNPYTSPNSHSSPHHDMASRTDEHQNSQIMSTPTRLSRSGSRRLTPARMGTPGMATAGLPYQSMPNTGTNGQVVQPAALNASLYAAYLKQQMIMGENQGYGQS